MKLKNTILLAILFSLFTAHSQQFSKAERYKQAMSNAKIALSAEQYSQAVMFYREALSIKPDELLPKYKIEDIRTIYIKTELDSLITKAPTVSKKKKKKELELESELLKDKAEEIATAKMNEEAEKEKQEITELLTVAEILEIDEDTIIADENIEIENIEPDRHIPLKKVETREIFKVENISGEKEKTIIPEKREMPKTIENIDTKPEDTFEVKKEIVIEPIKKPTVKKTLPPTKTEDWIKKENGKLAIKYPNNKTVEEIEKPGKQITRVIMNIEGKVTIYLKVKHSWGATFYFIDEVGMEPSSISEIHFNRMTDLKTYKNQ